MIGEKISSLEIADNDRIIKINWVNSKIFFAIRGKFTNVFYFDEMITLLMLSNLWTDQDLLNIKKEFEEVTFLDEWNSFEIKTENGEDLIDDIRKKYPFLGSEIVKEVKARIR